jgi:hypothetical protein
MSSQLLKPNWKRHITVTGKKNKNKLFKCNFCQHEFSGTGTRAVSHLAGGGVGVRACTVVPDSVRAMYKNTNCEMESVCFDSDLKPKAPAQTKMDSFGFGFDSSLATEQLALFCYTSGVSFVCFENPHFKEFCRLLNTGSLPPSRKARSTSLLTAENTSINKWKDGLLSQELICLTSDGYTDTALVNLINFEALTRFGPIYVATLQRSRTEADIWKDAKYIASKIKDCVQALGGTERVVGFVSDYEAEHHAFVVEEEAEMKKMLRLKKCKLLVLNILRKNCIFMV